MKAYTLKINPEDVPGYKDEFEFWHLVNIYAATSAETIKSMIIRLLSEEIEDKEI